MAFFFFVFFFFFLFLSSFILLLFIYFSWLLFLLLFCYYYYYYYLFPCPLYYVYALEQLNFYTIRKRRYHFDKLFLFKCTFVLYSVLLFWKLLAFVFLSDLSETLLCPLTAPQSKTVPLLNAQQLLMLFVGTLTYFKQKLLFLLIKTLILLNMNTCVHIFFLAA
jgi:hypothetical protein